MSKDNKQEYIEIDDAVRQGEYKYTYSDNSNIALKSEQADLVVGAVERFAQVIPLNLQEIFIWYFEQKGVDNPERFLMQQESAAIVPQTNLVEKVAEQSQNPENPITQIINRIASVSKNKEADISNLI